MGRVGLWWDTNTLVIYAWFEWLRTLVYMVVAYMAFKYLVLRFDAKILGNVDSEDELVGG